MNTLNNQPGTYISIATEIVQLLRKLVKRIAPTNSSFTMIGSNVTVGNSVTSQNINAAQSKFNSVIGSCLGNGAQINLFINSQNTSGLPDLVFISGVPSFQYFLPETEINYVTVQSTGSNPASFSIKFLNS